MSACPVLPRDTIAVSRSGQPIRLSGTSAKEARQDMYPRDRADRMAVVAARFVRAQEELGRALNEANSSAAGLYQEMIKDTLIEEDPNDLAAALAALVIAAVYADVPGETAQQRLKVFLDTIIGAYEQI